MEPDPTTELQYERDLFRTFNEGQMNVLKLLTEHHPSEEIRRAICAHAEAAMAGSQAITVRILPDGELAFVARRTIPDDLLDAVSERVRADAEIARTGPHPPRFEIPDPTDPERTVWGYVVPGIGGHPLGALCITRAWPTDHPERTEAAFYSAARLLQVALEQRRAATNTAAMIAAERERIANELHDDPIQSITVLSLTLQRISRGVSPELREQLDGARRHADEAIDRMRRMLFELHPAVLEDDGLAVAIEVYLEQTMEPLAIDWSLDDRLTFEPDPATAVLAYRLIHEALANVARHSQASTVSVLLDNVDHRLHAEIVDDGTGFDTSAVPHHRPGHLGIGNVSYLAQRAGGRLDVESSPGDGCTVRIWVPLDRPHTNAQVAR